MKKGWHIRKIGEVCDLMTGGTPPRSKAEYFGGDVKWLVSGDIHQGEIFDCEGRITEAGMRASNAKQLPLNSVMIALNGQGKTRGTVALLRTQATCNQSLVSIYPKEPGKLLPEFLFANLHGRYQEIRQMTGDSGNDRRGLNMGLIRQMEIPLAPVDEQQRIVGILDKAFDGIATVKANAEKNLQNARALFESHVVSIFTRGGQGWVQKAIGECFRVRSGDFLPARAMVETGGFDVYGGNGVAGRHDQRNLSGENIIIGRVGAKCGNVRHVIGDIWLTDNALYTSEYFYNFDLSFLARLLERAQLRSTANQTAQPVISYSTIKDVTLEFPSCKTEQEKIAKDIDALETETKRLTSVYERKLGALESLKKSLLHKAFNGNL